MNEMEKTMIFALLLLISVAGIKMNAQVTVGSDVFPQTTLDIIGDTANIHGDAFRLIDGNQGDGKVLTSDEEGIGTWRGMSPVVFAPVITVQPRAFSWKETTGAGDLTGIGGETATISITATGSDLTYQWYEVSRNPAAPSVLIAGANDAAYTPVLSDLGMRQYYCIVSNASGSVKSDIAKVAVGCGAMTADGNWYTFMCYNLGATAKTFEAQMTTVGNLYQGGAVASTPATGAAANAAVFGDLYQWGRVADGHQLRSSQNSSTNDAPSVGPYTAIDTPWSSGGSEQIVSASVDYGKFVVNASAGTGTDKGTYAPYDWNTNPSERNIFLWRNYRYVQNDPCVNLGDAGAAWRIPTVEEWSSIFRGDSGAGNPATSIANTWIWKAPGTTTNGATGTVGGYEIRPDGVTTTLFLPAAGYRLGNTGQLVNLGVAGYYWSTTAYGDFAYYLNSSNGSVIPANQSFRSYGFSVRCICEN